MSRAAWQALVMTAVVAVLGAAVGLSERRPIANRRTAVVPELDARSVTRIELTRPSQPTIAIAVTGRDARVLAPSPGAADPIAVRDLLSALATARADRWDRGAAAWQRAGLGAASLTIRVVHGGGTATVAVGAAVTSSGQRWLGLPPDRVALVPAWVGRALDRHLDELRLRRLVPTSTPTGLELHTAGLDLVLAGAALVRRDAGVSVRLGPEVRAAVVAAVAGLAFERFDDGARAEPVGTLRVLGGVTDAELAWFGACPSGAGLVQVEATIGVGCVSRAALDAVLAAATAAAAPTAVSAQPLDGAAPLAGLTIERGRDRVELVRHGATWTLLAGDVERAADPSLVAALEQGLAARAEVRAIAAAADPGAAERWRLRTTDGEAQAWQVWRTRDRVAIRRGDEPVVLELGPVARAAVLTAGVGVRDRGLVRLDPLRVAAIRAIGVAPGAVVRGELIGEWLGDPPGATATAAVATLSDWLGQLHVDGWTAATDLGRVRRTLVFTSDPPPGAGPATVDTVRVGAARPDGGCWVAVDDAATATLPAAACARLLAPLTR